MECNYEWLKRIADLTAFLKIIMHLLKFMYPLENYNILLKYTVHLLDFAYHRSLE